LDQIDFVLVQIFYLCCQHFDLIDYGKKNLDLGRKREDEEEVDTKKKKTRTTNKCTKISKDGDVNKNEKIKNKQSIKHLNKKSKQKPNKHYSGVLGDYNIEETLLEQIFFFFLRCMGCSGDQPRHFLPCITRLRLNGCIV